VRLLGSLFMFYRVLGPLEIEARGELLSLGGAKQRALLAVLLMRANEVVSRDVLIEDLWGEGGSAGSVHSLEVLVSRLRKILHAHEDQVLLTRPTGYVLQVGRGELDLSCFERMLQDGREALGSGAPEKAANTLREALALWRGKPFEDVAYESFAQVEIGRLEERRLVAVEERIEADLALGKAAELVAELEALVAQHPQRERLRGQLMLALYRSGRQAEALNAYQAARRELVEELGIEPGHTLRQLEQAILRQDPELEVVPGARAPVHEERAVRVHARLAERRRLLLIALSLLGLAAAAVGTAVALSSGGENGLATVASNSVGVIDPHSKRIVAEIPVGQRPTELAAVGGSLWVANFDSGTLSQVDSQSRKVMNVTNAGGTPTGLATGDGSVWVSNGFANRVLRIDKESGRVTAMIPIPGHPGAIAVDRNAVWVADTIADTVARIDPDSLQSTTIRVGRGPSGIATGDGSVWVANGLERTLTQIDSGTGTVVRPAIALRCAPASVAFGAGSVWVTCTTADDVERVDPRAGQGTATVRVGRGPTAIAIVDDRVWVADTFGRELSQIDPTDDAVVGAVETGGSPEGLALVRGELWAAVHGA
jgi:DNA-binding SARP family transcriptional activator/DNA-binding beta-propeller fold protein YncE